MDWGRTRPVTGEWRSLCTWLRTLDSILRVRISHRERHFKQSSNTMQICIFFRSHFYPGVQSRDVHKERNQQNISMALNPPTWEEECPYQPQWGEKVSNWNYGARGNEHFLSLFYKNLRFLAQSSQVGKSTEEHFIITGPVELCLDPSLPVGIHVSVRRAWFE